MDAFEPDEEMTVTDPVCGTRLAFEAVAAREEHQGWAYFFCSKSCHILFLAAPKRYQAGPAQGFGPPTGLG